jgi:hypothetical protein
LAAKICDTVNRRLGEERQVDPAMLNKRLLNFCRRGEANGGLPLFERRNNRRGGSD